MVRAARTMATGLHAKWIAVYVQTPRHLRMPQADRDRVNQTLRLAELLGARDGDLRHPGLPQRHGDAGVRARRRLGAGEGAAAEKITPGFMANIGFENILRVINDPNVREPFWRVFTWTLEFAFLTVLTQFGLGLIFALVLNSPYLPARWLETDKLLESGELSFAFVCSGPYTKDHEKFGAELLVAPQSYGQPFYHAYIIVPKDSTVKDLAGLKGKKFAFTDPKSNTGKIVPTYMIGKEFNTTPEKFFGKTIFTRSHDKSIEAVAKKLVDGASVDSLIYDYAAKKDPTFTSQTKIIKKSPKYGIPPVVVRKDTNPAIKAKIKEIFLNMHKDPEGKAILAGIMVDKFIVPKDSDYNSVREMDAWLKKVK